MRARVVAVLAVVVAVAAVAVAAWVRTLPNVPPQLLTGYGTDLPAGLLAVAWTVTGAVLVALRPRNVLGWLLLGVGVCQGLQQGLAAYGGYGVAMAGWPLARWAAWLASGLWLPGLLPLASLLLALYPDGRLPARWWRWPFAAAALGIALLTLGTMLAPQAYAEVAPGPAPLRAPALVRVGLLAVGGALCVGGTVGIWVASVVRLLRARPPERQQLAWLLLVVVPLLLVAFLTPSMPGFLALGFGVPVAIAVGVLRYRLLGIETVLRRGLVYGLLTATVVAVYLVVTAAAGTQLGRGPLPGVVAAALVAVGLTPLRDRLQVAVDRLVYGDRRDPMRAVTRLGDRVAAAGESDLLPAVLATVTDAVRAPGASLVATDGAVLATCGSRPVGGTAAEVVPLRVGGRELGRLQVAARSPGEPYTDGDRRLLAALAPQVAVVVRALELAEALEAERDRVVAVTRQERQRLRRDLHDGLGPSLSGVSLGLQALQDARAADDQAAADQLLARIREEVTTAVGEVRRILDDLRPAVLDSTRLPDALRRHAAAVSTGPLEVSVDAAADLPVLPPAVETAAYRITQEALTNVVRHAGAHYAHITLDTSDAALTITVSDDGHGINSTTHPGVGLTSMRQRAQALRGTLRVDSSDHGTTVMAILPLQDGSS
jgi:signal transduction histidine kinase